MYKRQVWYRGEERYVGMEPPHGDGWERDPDVLDTWFSSGIWPFVTLGWPDRTAALKAFYPTDVLSTARDILFLWVARMIMMGLEFVDDIPFDRVYVHSIIQAPDGRRMSKSLGTGIDPLDLIGGGPRPPVFEQGGEFPAYGADAVRYGLLAMSSTQDVRFNEEKIAQGRQLANKLWNAARLVLLRVPDDVTLPESAPAPQTIEDAWILSRLQGAKAEVARAIDAFEFHHAALGLYDFVYGELCDWYLEMVKPRLYEQDEAVSATALHVLGQTLALAHPVLPFVTEEINSFMPGADLDLAVTPFPAADESLLDDQAEREIATVIEAVRRLRNYRDSVGAPAAARIPARLVGNGYEDALETIGRLARFDISSDSDGEPVGTVALDGASVEVLPTDTVDTAGAQARLEQQRGRLLAEIERARGKLGNEGFTAKAPPELVQAERDKLERFEAELAELES